LHFQYDMFQDMCGPSAFAQPLEETAAFADTAAMLTSVGSQAVSRSYRPGMVSEGKSSSAPISTQASITGL